MRWKDENAHLAKAEEIQQSWPDWLVWWGVSSRRYWAIPLFDTTNRLLSIRSADPDELIAGMDEAERGFRIRPGREGGDRE